MRDRESIEKVAESDLRSLVTQTAQIGLGFGAMLIVTGGKPSPAAIAATAVGGIAFVAVAEERRLDAKHKRLAEKYRQELKEKD